MPSDADTIAAIATAAGRGAIGIVRVSGKGLADVAKTLSGAFPAPRQASFARFRDADGSIIDEGLLLYFPAPYSFTGEDVLELHAHGGPVVLQLLLRRCLALGARLAEPGEFTRRAFLNDKLDLAQAEAVIDLIDAANEAAVRSAGRSLRGEFSKEIEKLVEGLISVRMHVEATIDFPEEEIDPADRQTIRAGVDRLALAVGEILGRAQQGSLLRTGLNVVLAGQPNVGKSSLLNRLAGEELAIVTEIPGTTRDVVRQTIYLEGLPVNIIDTAGLRETEDAVEQIGIARAWKEIEQADLLLLLVDARSGVGAEDEDILRRLPASLRRLTVYNKIDLVDASALPDEADDMLCVSAKTGQGVPALRERLEAIAGWQGGSEDLYLARERHLVALREAREALARAQAADPHWELLAEELRLAQAALSRITGAFTADDLLGEIFSRFCIGK
ncbi:MAG TPA: tRNA uridine-5-carboxymethylaminomethyl(34) synthesis GTPase MnmE [Burkholderiales bacterium]|nr:tRNA uridine-5-carboxymethylaminomethyl(34) synthesis GTPase MnmE [Burkholderiales bacterium]